jgi:hypothetical protein
MNPKLIGALLGIVLVGGAGFWSGTAYAAHGKTSANRFVQGAGTFQGEFAGRTAGGSGMARTGQNAVFGTVISKDVNGITVQLGGPGATSTNGTASGTRIVLINSATQVTKMTAGSAADLAPGTGVTITGTANSDGSLTAASVQIRPASAAR